jgi:CRP-like cAMP-binding protein
MRYIVEGTAVLSAVTVSGQDIPFAVLDRDEVLGLTALTRQGVSAKATATTDLAVLFVPVAVLDELVKTRPRLARDVGVGIDNRQAQANAAFESAGIPAKDRPPLIT